MSKKRHVSKSVSANSSSRRQHASRYQVSGGWWIGLGIGIVVLIAAAFLLFRPTSSAPAEISAAQAYEKYQQGALFVDVRSQREWRQGHIARSASIPLDELPNRLGELPRERDIVVVCKSGVRSKEGASILRQAGFARVSCLNGGIQSWSAAGYPVEQ